MNELQVTKQYDLVKKLDRGQLKYPSEDVINIVLYNLLVVEKLLDEINKGKFLRVKNQRSTVVQLTLHILSTEEMYLEIAGCPSNHDSSYICKEIIWSSTNIMLKNFCKKGIIRFLWQKNVNYRL